MRWAGKLGYVQQTEIEPGNWEDVVTEVDGVGDLVSMTERVVTGSTLLPQYETTTTLSVVTGAGRVIGKVLRYATLYGVRMEVTSVAHQHPRLLLTIGGEYHGPLPAGTSGDPGSD